MHENVLKKSKLRHPTSDIRHPTSDIRHPTSDIPNKMNVIADRIAFFLKDFPPFSFFSYERIREIALSVTVKFIPQNEFVFEQNEENNGFVYVLNKGIVELFRDSEDVVDYCEPGDIFGVRSVLSSQVYSMSARVVDECLIYAIPKALFLSLISENQQMSLFFAAGYASGQAVVRGGQKGARLFFNLEEDAKIEFQCQVLTCYESESIKAVANLMKEHKVGSIVIKNEQKFPIGIVTDKDFRNKVVSEGLDSSEPIKKIMSCPVLTVSQNVTLSECELKMIQNEIHHLIVTKDGTSQSEIIGIISNHDVLLHQISNAKSIVKAIQRSNNPQVWKKWRDKADILLKRSLERGVSTQILCGIIAQINDTIVKKAIEKAESEFEINGNYCWLSLGSEGRKEQLIRTDQDNALVYISEKNEEKKAYIDFSARVTKLLEFCGFEACPAEIMASNPLYCLNLDEWKKLFSKWIQNPDPENLMKTSIFFDFRAIAGDSELAKELKNHIAHECSKEPLFIHALAKNALQNPSPISLFRNLKVEKSGNHEHEFDLKKRVIMPYVDVARLLVLQHQIEKQNTVERFRELKKMEPRYSELFEDAAQAFELILRFRVNHAISSESSGRYIRIQDMGKLEKSLLKSTFAPLKELQELIEIRFKTEFF